MPMGWRARRSHIRRVLRALSFFALLLSLFTPSGASAQSNDPDVVTPIELALFSPVHIFHGDRKLIAGLSVNIIYGQTWRQYGLEVGVVNYELDAQVGI